MFLVCKLGISAKYVTALSLNRITFNSFIIIAFGCKMLICRRSGYTLQNLDQN